VRGSGRGGQLESCGEQCWQWRRLGVVLVRGRGFYQREGVWSVVGLLMNAVEVEVAVGVATLTAPLLPLFTLVVDSIWRLWYQVLALDKRQTQNWQRRDKPLPVIHPFGRPSVHTLVHPSCHASIHSLIRHSILLLIHPFIAASVPPILQTMCCSPETAQNLQPARVQVFPRGLAILSLTPLDEPSTR
jgi:hypothetical protein